MDIEILILEYVLLVSGILLALFIDKLNEKRRHKNRIHSIMNIIIQNMKKDIEKVKEKIKEIDRDNKLYNKFYESRNKTGEEINDLLIKAHGLAVSVGQLFSVSDRGYHLLKDARVDFEFKDSTLISEIVHYYNRAIPWIDQDQKEQIKEAQKNIRHQSKFSWFQDFDVTNNDLLEYLRSEDHQQRCMYMNWLKTTILKRDLSMYKSHLEDFLEKINQSDYK